MEVVLVGVVATWVDHYIMKQQMTNYEVELGLDKFHVSLVNVSELYMSNKPELSHKVMKHRNDMSVWIHLTFLQGANVMTFPWKLHYFWYFEDL